MNTKYTYLFLNATLHNMKVALLFCSVQFESTFVFVGGMVPQPVPLLHHSSMLDHDLRLLSVQSFACSLWFPPTTQHASR